MINCASTYPAVLLGPGHRKNRALEPASLEGGQRLPGAPSLGRSPPSRARIGFSPGPPAPADQREETTLVSQRSATQRRQSFGSAIYTATMTTQVCRRRRVGCVRVAPRRLGSALQACRARRSSRAAHRWRRAYRGVTAARRPRAADDQRRRPPHDLDRLAVGVLLVSFAEEQAAARGSQQAAQKMVGAA